MDWRNRIGLYGAYFLGLSGIGFTLPYLPLYLRQQEMSDRTIGIVSTLAALAGLAQFPIGVWSDRIKWRKPFLIVLLAVLALPTWLLRDGSGVVWLALLVILFAENGICRATAESLFGAEVAQLAPPDRVGAALGMLRFWKPLGVIAVALMGGVLAEQYGIGSILMPLTVVQALAVVAALLIHEHPVGGPVRSPPPSEDGPATRPESLGLKDRTMWVFIVAMILFHIANAPGGVYLGLFLNTDLHAPNGVLSWAFIIDMVVWMLVVWPAGRLADRLGRKPLLVVGWSAMTLRLVLVALAQAPWQVLYQLAVICYHERRPFLEKTPRCNDYLWSPTSPSRRWDAVTVLALTPRRRPAGTSSGCCCALANLSAANGPPRWSDSPTSMPASSSNAGMRKAQPASPTGVGRTKAQAS